MALKYLSWEAVYSLSTPLTYKLIEIAAWVAELVDARDLRFTSRKAIEAGVYQKAQFFENLANYQFYLFIP